MDWDRRDRVFVLGAPLAVIPAVAFLPAFVFVCLQSDPAVASPQIRWRVLVFPLLVFVQVLGSILIGIAGFHSRVSYVTLLAMATSVLLMVVSAYTGLFFAIFAGPN